MKASKVRRWMYVCPNCGYIGKGQRKGALILELALWICFLVPGIIYSVWRYTGKTNICKSCGCKNMVPVKTPKGQQLVEQYAEPDTPEEELTGLKGAGIRTVNTVWRYIQYTCFAGFLIIGVNMLSGSLWAGAGVIIFSLVLLPEVRALSGKFSS